VFPRDFVWGVATSAFQIEGATSADGRGVSIWDVFCREPGRVRGGDTGDVACDHYRRFEADLDLMAWLGITGYRFSIAWPRIFPDGTGAPKRSGVEFYRRLVEGLRSRGIVPMATLYHWDLPQALEARGGWRSRETVDAFVAYATYLFEELGELVPLWITHNEPRVTAHEGYGTGVKAPGARDWRAAIRAAHHVLLSHGLAVQAFRKLRLEGSHIGIALDPAPVYPAGAGAQDVEAARWLDGFHNRWFLEPLLHGAYPADMLASLRRRLGVQPPPRAEVEAIAAPIDFLGVNYYRPARVRAGLDGAFPPVELAVPAGETTAMGWEIAPAGLEELLVHLARETRGLPLYVTESGAAFHDLVVDGCVEDAPRIRYLEAHVEAVARALRAGADVRGYFVWSLLDNFEWQEGYAQRFGLVYVDYETQARIPKASAHWYRDLIAAWRAQRARR
jgi:beta-glucosidase